VKRALQLDKKFREGRNVFVLPTAIGTWQQRENIDWALVDSTIRKAIE
jgi:3-dehydroquinate synthetase